MRRWVLLAVLCVIPVGATAQTIDGGVPSYVVGNTLVAGTPMVMLANGKGHHGKGHGPSRGGGAPAPSAAPAPAQSFSEGRGESSYSFQGQPLRVQIEEPTVTPHPVITWPPVGTQYPAQTVDVAPFAVQPTGATGTLTIPVQVLFRQPVAQATPYQYQRSQGQWGGVCPTGCVVPEVPRQQPVVCNAMGQCIQWP